MDNQHRKIAGYRELNDEEIKFINNVKRVGENLGMLFDSLETAAVENALHPDKRWLAIAKTDLQKGLMALTRAVAKPETF